MVSVSGRCGLFRPALRAGDGTHGRNFVRPVRVASDICSSAGDLVDSRDWLVRLALLGDWRKIIGLAPMEYVHPDSFGSWSRLWLQPVDAVCGGATSTFTPLLRVSCGDYHPGALGTDSGGDRAQANRTGHS